LTSLIFNKNLNTGSLPLFMNIIKFNISKIKIDNFSPKDKALDLTIHFNDGANKEISKIVEINDPYTLSEFIVSDIRGIIKQAKGNVVPITITDEEELIHKISIFFSKVADKIDNIKRTKVAEGYLQLIREVNNMQLKL
ncbi:hypothetical protein J4209_02300, partial [Candidatus Woesearchaeota archaeon]|nr:hypothetical protein [Candidatus Woesearchaeota archaeon]